VFRVLREAVEGPSWENQCLFVTAQSSVITSARQCLDFAWNKLDDMRLEKRTFMTEADMQNMKSLQGLVKSTFLFIHGLLDGRLGVEAHDRLVRDAIVSDINTDRMAKRLTDIHRRVINSHGGGKFQKKIHTMKQGIVDVLTAVGSTILNVEDDTDITEHRNIDPEAFMIGKTLSMLASSSMEEDDISWLKLQRVRIVWNKRVEDMYFRTPEMLRTFQVGDAVREFLELTVDTIASDKKLELFVEFALRMKEEAQWAEELRKYGLSSLFSSKLLQISQHASYYIVFLVNMCLLMSMVYPYDADFYRGDPVVMDRMIFWSIKIDFRTSIILLSMCESCIATYIVLYYCVVKLPTYMNGKDRNLIRFMLHDSMILWYIVLVFLATLGTFYSYMFLPFLLLDHIPNDPTLLIVVKAVSTAFDRLAKTFWLMIISLFIFASIQFVSFPTDYSGGECQQLWSCTLSYLNYGMRNGGGIGESLFEWEIATDESMWISRSLYDLEFFVAIQMFLANVVFGVIVDNFAELRDGRKEQSEDRENVCYICGVDRDQFNRAHLSFEDHKNHDHHLPVYLRFIVYVMTKERNDLTGLEDYVYQCIKNGSLEWLPVQHVVKLHGRRQDDDNENEGHTSIQARLERIEKKLCCDDHHHCDNNHDDDDDDDDNSSSSKKRIHLKRRRRKKKIVLKKKPSSLKQKVPEHLVQVLVEKKAKEMEEEKEMKEEEESEVVAMKSEEGNDEAKE